MEDSVIVIKTKDQTLEIITAEFTIDDDNVDGELCKTGANLCFYGNLAADLEAEVASEKAKLEYTYATIALGLRAETTTKLTEGGVKERTITNPEYVKQKYILIETERNYIKANNFWKTQQKRTDCIIALAYKQRTEIAKSHY